VGLLSGATLQPKGLQLIPAGDRVVIDMPGGGGMGPASERDPEAVRRDVRLGYVGRGSDPLAGGEADGFLGGAE
jgi:N-methylhydantoinase B